MRQSYAAFFVQDDWRFSDNLSLNYGLRYEFVTTPKELNGQVAGLLSFDDLESGPLGVTPGTPMFDNPSKKSFAPRLGAAWNPFGDKRSTVKGGYGIFYQPLTTSFYRGTTFRIYPYFAGIDIRQPAVFGPENKAVLAAGVNPALVQKRSEFISYDLEQPFMQQWHLNVERDLGFNAVGEVGYIGSKGHNLPFYGDPNTRPSFYDENGVKRLVPGARAPLPELGPDPHAHQQRAVDLPRHDGRSHEAVFRRLAGAGGLHAGRLPRTRGRAARSAAPTSTTARAARPTGGTRNTSSVRPATTSATTWSSTASTCCRSARTWTAFAGALAKGWQIGGVLQFSSGLPFTPFLVLRPGG